MKSVVLREETNRGKINEGVCLGHRRQEKLHLLLLTTKRLPELEWFTLIQRFMHHFFASLYLVSM